MHAAYTNMTGWKERFLAHKKCVMQPPHSLFKTQPAAQASWPKTACQWSKRVAETAIGTHVSACVPHLPPYLEQVRASLKHRPTIGHLKPVCHLD
jgi:hypothetical protein